jgi:hypothetical protein
MSINLLSQISERLYPQMGQPTPQMGQNHENILLCYVNKMESDK